MPWENDEMDTTPPAGTFEIPQTNHPWFHGVANSWPKSAMSTTTPEQIQKQVQVQQENQSSAADRLAMFNLKKVK
jgi:hypothetical protein